MTHDFLFGSGSVAGRDHRRIVPKNRQDDFFLVQNPTLSIAIVADGCGSGGLASIGHTPVRSIGSSEVGASLGVRLLGHLLAQYHKSGIRRFDEKVLKRVQRDLVARLRSIAVNMGSSLSEVVDRYFLFTLVGVIITKERATFFALGDGVIFINGDMTVLSPESGNQPLYLGYALTGSSLTKRRSHKLDFVVVDEISTDDLQHFLIGTDGLLDFIEQADSFLPGMDTKLGKISQFWTERKYVENLSAVERQLNLAARDWTRRLSNGANELEGGLLHDDTTLIVGRRDETGDDS